MKEQVVKGEADVEREVEAIAVFVRGVADSSDVLSSMICPAISEEDEAPPLGQLTVQW